MSGLTIMLLLTATASCEHTSVVSEADCPEGARVSVVELRPGTQRTCEWEGRKTIVHRDADGEVLERWSMQDGELDGLQITREPTGDLRMETTYRRGLLNGWSRHFRGEQIVHECFSIDGVPDGVCWSKEGLGDIRQFDRGKRTGFWSFSHQGQVVRTLVFGDDIMLARDGQPLPLPPPSIEVDGEVLSRTECPRTSARHPCRVLFDEYQACELDSTDREGCRARARSDYRQERSRKNYAR